MNPEGEQPEIPQSFQQAFELPGDPTFSPDFPAPEITMALPSWKDRAENGQMQKCAYVDIDRRGFLHEFDGTTWNVKAMAASPRIHEDVTYDGLLIRSGMFRQARTDIFSELDRMAPHMPDGTPLVLFEATSDTEDNSISPRDHTLREHGFEMTTLHRGDGFLVWEGRRVNDKAELELIFEKNPAIPDELKKSLLASQLPEGKILHVDSDHPTTARLLDRNKAWQPVVERGTEIHIDPNKRDSRRIAGVIIEVPGVLDSENLPNVLVAKAGSWIRRTAKRDEKGTLIDEHLGAVFVVGLKGEKLPTKKDLEKMFREAGLVIDESAPWVYEAQMDDGRMVVVTQARAHKFPRPMPDFVREKMARPKPPTPGETRVTPHLCGRGGCQEHLVEKYYSEQGHTRELLFRDTACPSHGLRDRESGHEYVMALDLLPAELRSTPRPQQSRGRQARP